MTNQQVVSSADILAEEENFKEVSGLTIRKETVAAVLANIDILESQISSATAKNQALDMIKKSAPALVALGLSKHVLWKNPLVQAIADDR